MHAYHDGLPGFDPAQILHDGCDECEARGNHVDVALSHLDHDRFEAAWLRAVTWGTDGLQSVSTAELPLLKVLWVLAVMFERRGVPLGVVPS
jgi:hypothetical protein